MKPKATGKREKAARALLMRRTYSIWKHMAERAEKAGAGLPITLSELRDQVRPCIDTPIDCRYCEEPLKVRTFSLDHNVPIERGGQWEQWNLDVICDRCNRAKGTMTGDEFKAVLRVLRGMPTSTRNDVLGRLKAGAAVRRLVLTKRKAA